MGCQLSGPIRTNRLSQGELRDKLNGTNGAKFAVLSQIFAEIFAFVESRMLWRVFRDGVVLKSLGCRVIGPCMVVGDRCHVGCHSHHCCRCSVAASGILFLGCLEPQQFGRLFVDTPSWCDGSLIITPPTVEEVVEEVAAVVRCLSVAVVAFFSPLVVKWWKLFLSPTLWRAPPVNFR